MKQDFKMSVNKSFVHQDNVTHNLSYYMDPKKIPEIISGWESAGYEVISVTEGVPVPDFKEDE